ncbi:MAG: DUF4232 domain-containing protein [Dermatophilaceae bacterium]
MTACGDSLTAPAAGSTTTTAGTSLGASSPASPSTAGGSPSQTSSPAAGDLPACANADLTVSVGTSGAGMGHVGLTIVFTNSSDHQCTLTGYPGVAGMDSTGREVTQALQTLTGYMGGSSTKATVPLAPGGRASALVEGTDVPTGTATTCPVYPRLLVTAPNQTGSHVLVSSMPGCSLLQVHPVVAGATGRA